MPFADSTQKNMLEKGIPVSDSWPPYFVDQFTCYLGVHVCVIRTVHCICTTESSPEQEGNFG